MDEPQCNEITMVWGEALRIKTPHKEIVIRVYPVMTMVEEHDAPRMGGVPDPEEL